MHRVPLNGSIWLGSTGFVDDPIINMGSLQAKGIDLDANYRFDVGSLGQVTLSLVGNYADEFVTEPLPGYPKYDCAGLYGAVCGVPLPEWRHKLRTSWLTPWGLDLSLTWRHINEVDVDGTNPDTGAPPIAATDIKLGARDYIDLSAAYSFTDVGVFSDLTGAPRHQQRHGQGSAAARGDATASAGTAMAIRIPQVYDTLGRYVFVGLTADF